MLQCIFKAMESSSSFGKQQVANGETICMRERERERERERFMVKGKKKQYKVIKSS